MIYMLVFAKTFSVYLRKEVKNLPSTTKTGSGSHAKSLGNPTARVRFKSRTSSKKFDFSRILQYSSRIPRILFQNLLKAMSGACRGHSIFYSHPRPSEDDQNPNPPIYVDVLWKRKFKGFVLCVLLWKIRLKGQNFVGFLEEKIWTPPPPIRKPLILRGLWIQKGTSLGWNVRKVMMFLHNPIFLLFLHFLLKLYKHLRVKSG